MEEYIKKFMIKRNETGNLTCIEGERDISFLIRRVYYIYNVKSGERRGLHAHKKLEQYLICVSGSCEIMLEDSNGRSFIKLNDPSIGVYIGSMVWHEMFNFTPEAVLLVIASDYYNEADYIRDYEEFKILMKKKKRKGSVEKWKYQ